MANWRPREWISLICVPLLSLIVAIGGAAYLVGSLEQRVKALEERQTGGSVVFGDWQLMEHDEEYRAETDGFVIVRSHGDTGKAESDFEVFVEMNGSFRAVTRGGQYQGAASPVPAGSQWAVRRGGSSNNGGMSVYWLPMKQIHDRQ